MGEEELSWGWDEFVCDVFAADGVCLGRVGDFDCAVVLRFGIEAGGRFDGRTRNSIEIPRRVSVWVDGCCMRFLDDDGIAVAIYCRVGAQTEDVLVVLGEGARRDDGAVVTCFVGVDVHDADDACGAGFNSEARREVEFVVEDVLVVG